MSKCCQGSISWFPGEVKMELDFDTQSLRIWNQILRNIYLENWLKVIEAELNLSYAVSEV